MAGCRRDCGSRSWSGPRSHPRSSSRGFWRRPWPGEGIPVRPGSLAGEPALIGADSQGRIGRPGDCAPGACPGLTITSTTLLELPRIAARVRGEDMLIVLERPPPVQTLLSIGIAGSGFEDGNLTSASTRRDGYVLSTDLLPTILARYGIDVPEDVAGREIETGGGAPDVAGVAELEARLVQVSSRRWPVLGVNLLIWLGLVAAAAVLGRRRGAGHALTLLAVSVALVPAVLLVGAATTPSVLGERLIVGLGTPLLAGLSLLLMHRLVGSRAPFAAFALAAAASIGATALDVVLGSPLTALSLIGPNLSIGVRFFGIGNELEASIAALLLLGTAAGVRAFDPPDPRRAVAIATVLVTALAVLVFAPGRFGADVGAAITFPAGAAAVVIAAFRLRPGKAALVLAAPVVAACGADRDRPGLGRRLPSLLLGALGGRARRAGRRVRAPGDPERADLPPQHRLPVLHRRPGRHRARDRLSAADRRSPGGELAG